MTHDAVSGKTVSLNITPERALEMIAEKHTPCRQCGKPHVQQEPRGRMAGSWADPDDGHIYYPMKVEELAKVVLDARR